MAIPQLRSARKHLWLLLLLALLALTVQVYQEERASPGRIYGARVGVLGAIAFLLAHVADTYVKRRGLRWTLNGLALLCVGLLFWFRLKVAD